MEYTRHGLFLNMKTQSSSKNKQKMGKCGQYKSEVDEFLKNLDSGQKLNRTIKFTLKLN